MRFHLTTTAPFVTCIPLRNMYDGQILSPSDKVVCILTKIAALRSVYIYICELIHSSSVITCTFSGDKALLSHFSIRKLAGHKGVGSFASLDTKINGR